MEGSILGMLFLTISFQLSGATSVLGRGCVHTLN